MPHKLGNKNTNNRAKALIAKHLREIISKDIKGKSFGLVSVNEIEVTSDLGLAKIYVSFLGVKDKFEALEHLKNKGGMIRSSLAHMLSMRKTPELRFYLDESYDNYEHISELLKH